MFWNYCLVDKSCLALLQPHGLYPSGSLSRRFPRLEWVVISFSRGSFWPRDQTHVPCIGRWILYQWATKEALWNYWVGQKFIQTFNPILYLQKQKVEPFWFTDPNLLTLNVTYWMQINFYLVLPVICFWLHFGCKLHEGKSLPMTLSPLRTIVPRT